MTRAEREEGKRLREATTPGTWRQCYGGEPLMVGASGMLVGEFQHEADAEFVCHARTAYPAALKEIERLEAENAALREALLDVTPPHHKHGTCWCGIGRDIETYGHDSSCERARDLLQTAMEALTTRTVERAHGLLEGKDAE